MENIIPQDACFQAAKAPKYNLFHCDKFCHKYYFYLRFYPFNCKAWAKIDRQCNSIVTLMRMKNRPLDYMRVKVYMLL